MYNNKIRKYLIIALIISWGFTFLSFKYGPQDKRLYRQKRVMMGTFVEVISPDKSAANIAFAEIKRIEEILNKYNPDSEVSKLNKLGRLTVSPETFYVIKKAKEFWLSSEGAFDITVAKLADLWGFTDKQYILPKKAEIENALKLTGTDKIILHEFDNVVQFKIPGMKIDLGAIAKGYALDYAVKKLKESGIKSCLINAGGQIYCLGRRFSKPWRIGIKDPRRIKSVTYLELENKAVATSGDYEQYFLKDKKRYSHIFNPKTGYPAETKVVSVTVIAEDGLTADALGTAIFVLGKDKGERLAKQFGSGVQVKIIEEGDITRI